MQLLLALIFAFSLLLLFDGQTVVGCQTSSDEFSKGSSWQPPDAKRLKSAFAKWINESNLDAKSKVSLQINSILDAEFLEPNRTSGREFIDLILECLIIGRPELANVRQTLSHRRTDNVVPDLSEWLSDSNRSDFLKDHVRLYFGRWLAQNEFYDEALDQFDQIELSKTQAPATLLFYRGLMEHQLLRKDECLATLKTLMEHSGNLPRRFSVMSKMMMADIQPLEIDSLDEVARIMGDIRRRTSLYRSGQIVRDQEKDVVAKLDKLIEDLESQQNSQQQASGSSPSKPMQDSLPSSGKGSGDVARKLQSDGGQWGDLPPAKRAAALAEMAKDMPPHYREVIEEYFKQLAKEDK
jgi:hypothetical protein